MRLWILTASHSHEFYFIVFIYLLSDFFFIGHNNWIVTFFLSPLPRLSPFTSHTQAIKLATCKLFVSLHGDVITCTWKSSSTNSNSIFFFVRLSAHSSDGNCVEFLARVSLFLFTVQVIKISGGNYNIRKNCLIAEFLLERDKRN